MQLRGGAAAESDRLRPSRRFPLAATRRSRGAAAPQAVVVALGMTLAVGLTFGLFLAVQSARLDLIEALHSA